MLELLRNEKFEVPFLYNIFRALVMDGFRWRNIRKAKVSRKVCGQQLGEKY
jgi:hypothetical protein